MLIHYHFAVVVWRAKLAESSVVKYWEIIADNFSKAGWRWAASQPSTRRGERSGLLTHIATVSLSLCVLMKG